MHKFDKGDEAIWVAAAIMTYEKIMGIKNSNNQWNKDSIYFKQSIVLKNANLMCNKKIEAARISYHLNAENPKSSHKYFIKNENEPLVRLVYCGEMEGNKEKPESVNLHIIVDTLYGEKSIEELFDFIDNEYTYSIKEEVYKKLLAKEDYIEILNFLKENANEKYIKPEKNNDQSEKKKYEVIKEKAQKSIKSLKKIGDNFKRYGYVYDANTSTWLDGTNKKVRRYLWMELKKINRGNLSTSISIVAEIEGELRFRVSLEIRDNKSEETDYVRHFKYLDILDVDNTDFEYFGSRNDGLDIDKTSKKGIKSWIAEVKNRKTNKIQIGKTLNYEKLENMDENEISKFFEESFKELMKYYDVAVGSEGDNVVVNKIETKGITNKNQILYGPPGTGKTYNVINKALEIINKEMYTEMINNPLQREWAVREFNELSDSGQISFCTFHQSYGYEDFVEGLRSNENGNGFIAKDGIFKQICKRADDKKNYVIIIDEINRGNISKIFGELITLIEADKRIGEKNEIKVTLPYSNEIFGVPSNLYILGTMNTADRSIALLDTALRRRFEFIEYMPNENLLPEDIEGINVRKLLKTINDRIEFLFDKDHTIGHSYFICENLNLDVLVNIMKSKVIPLIEEYFYGDWEKISLVLGGTGKIGESSYFVIKEKVNKNKLFNGMRVDDYEDQYRYSIADRPTKDAFKNILGINDEE